MTISIAGLESNPSTTKTTILWLDGCFDGFHYAHANAFRQARDLISGPVHLLACVHSDAEILKNKGPPLFDESERYALVAGCRFVDQVVEDAPYIPRLEVLDSHRADYLVHGDDPVVDFYGNDIYAVLKHKGRYREFKRTDGISTTSIIQRLLTPGHIWPDQKRLYALLNEFLSSILPPPPVVDLASGISFDLEQITGRRVVYIGDSWDCFGSDHVEYLRRAKEVLPSSAILAVGVWSDEAVKAATGEKPLFTMLERALAVLQCKHTDAIVLNTHPDLQVVLHSLNVQVAVVDEHHDLPEGLLKLVVPKPRLQSLPSLRAKVKARREAYIQRQRRKGVL